MSFKRVKNIGLTAMVAIMVAVSLLTHLALTPVSQSNIENLRNMQSLQSAFQTYSEFQEVSLLFERQIRNEQYDFSKISQSLEQIIRDLRLQQQIVEGGGIQQESFANLIRSARFFLMSIHNYQVESSVDPAADNTFQMEEVARQAQESFAKYYNEFMSIVREKDFNLHGQIIQSISKSQKISLLGLVIGVATSITIAVVLAKALKKPLTRLAEGTEKVAEGNLDFQLEVVHKDEIGSLAQSFNHMAKNLRNTMISKSYLDDILRSMVDSLIVIDCQGSIKRVNRATVSMLGYQREDEFLGMGLNRILCDDKFGIEGVMPLAEKEFVRNIEKYYCTASGEKVPVLFSSSTLRDRDNQVVGFVCVAKDDRERKAIVEKQKVLEQQLQQKKKMEAIGTLAGGIAHDFNNLLAVICGYAQIFKSKLPQDSEMEKDVDEVLKAGRRATELVKQILAFSRKSEHKLQYVKAQHIITEVLQMLRPSLPATVSITEDIDRGCGYIKVDPDKLYQILMNLCTNAFHAMEKEKGTLTVALKQREVDADEITNDRATPGSYIVLTVRDTGCGMDEQIMEKIFDPFFTTKVVGKGTGLGLAVIHGIIEDYRGFVEVESESGTGTSFHIYLQACPAGFIPSAEPLMEEKAVQGNEHILVVDDEPLVIDIHKTTLEQLGYQVTATADSINALELLSADPDSFDLLITDQTMPKMTGAELAQKALAVKPDLPIILCTGYSSVVSREDSQALGVARYVEKPVSIEKLSQVVRQVLDEYAERQARTGRQ